MNITVIGVGYVGLVTGACLAEMGVTVCCVDSDQAKIEILQQNILPIYEPGLAAIVHSNVAAQRLTFSTALSESINQSLIFFIAVGTPPCEDGSADLGYVLNVARQIGQQLENYAVIVNKSTVPVGSAQKVRAVIQEELDRRAVDVEFSVVSNPEFLKEGSGVQDFMRPDRIIIGCEDSRAATLMRSLYAPFTRNHQRTIFVGIREAEMIKYAANAMLATKISFINEIANLCEKLQVDVEAVREGIGSDSRIGYSFIYPGCGYGGSCFPKDVKALVQMARQYDFEPHVLLAVEERNRRQHHLLFNKLFQRFGEHLPQKTVGLWGLSFKPGTDDMREAPSRYLLESLMAIGVKVKAYDPVAMDEARRILPAQWFDDGLLSLVKHQYEALEGADCLVLVTEWKPFRTPDVMAMKRLMKALIIFDGRNQYDIDQMKSEGFEYHGIGRELYDGTPR